MLLLYFKVLILAQRELRMLSQSNLRYPNWKRASMHFFGDHTPVKQLKGDIAEFWHAGTFNVNTAINESANRATVERSTDFASVDVSSNFGVDYGLKYYATAEESAKVQATSVFQRFMEYQHKGGKDSLEKFLADRHYTSEDVLNDPIYEGQVRLIPADQLKAATTWLQEKNCERSYHSSRAGKAVPRYS